MANAKFNCELCKVTTYDEKAYESHLLGGKHQAVLNSKLKLEKTKKCGIYVTGFPKTATTEVLANLFLKYGAIDNYFSDRNNNFFIILYQKEDSAKTVLNTKVYYEGHLLTVRPRKVKDNVVENRKIPNIDTLPIFTTHINNTDTRQSERLAKAFIDLEILKKQNLELRNLFNDLNIGDQEHKEVLDTIEARVKKTENVLNNQREYGQIDPKEEPNLDYEKLRRRIAANTQEMWYFVKSEIVKVQKQSQSLAPELIEPLNHILNLGVQHKRALLKDINSLAEVDGYSAWREKEAYSLSDLVQRRLKYLQNPSDCNNARKLICNLNKGCGYGCQLHHAVYCFMVAYGTERTLILKSKGWRYHKAGWEEIFKPVSDTCTDPSGHSQSSWPGKVDTQVLTLPIIDSVSPRPPYLPLAIPEDLAPRLNRLHGDPIVWWVGQFLKYLLRPQSDTSNFLNEAISKMGFQRPIVGVHVRRTDKVGTEAAFHSIDEYMSVVEEYYNQLELTQRVAQRRIYVASDDPKVILEARKKYPHYEVLGDPSVAKTAAVASRYSDTSLKGIILDIHLLSMSDYLVCTFSSQVCRVAYEIMQNYYPDASSRFHSLDDIYYYGGQNAHNQLALISHEPKRQDEMELIPGDLVGVAGNHWNGYSKGRNLRTNMMGLYPSFKVENKVEIVKFPTYPEVPLTPQHTDEE
ncbi:alpha16-fucosyltransferase [Carabus blaptoides fortunei]